MNEVLVEGLQLRRKQILDQKKGRMTVTEGEESRTTVVPGEVRISTCW